MQSLKSDPYLIGPVDSMGNYPKTRTMGPMGFTIDATTTASGKLLSVVVIIKERSKVQGYLKAYELLPHGQLTLIVRATKVNEQNQSKLCFEAVFKALNHNREAYWTTMKTYPISPYGPKQGISSIDSTSLRMMHMMDGWVRVIVCSSYIEQMLNTL